MILISNDDGVHAKGIEVLAREIGKWADVIVVAPDREQSAASHSLTLHRPLRIQKIKKEIYAVDGTPTDCIMLAVHQIMKARPDIIVSGINRGANLGDDVHYSGTVSAAMEGAILGIRSVAVSLAVFGDGRCHFETAAGFASKFCKRLLKIKNPKGLLFNINVPNVRADEICGCEVTRLGKRNYGDIIIEKTDPRGRRYYWIGGDESGFYNVEDSDCLVVNQKKISVTPLKKDLTNHSFKKEIKRVLDGF